MLQSHHLRPRGYTAQAFRADEIKEALQQAMDARVNFHRCSKNVSDEGTPGIVATCGNALF